MLLPRSRQKDSHRADKFTAGPRTVNWRFESLPTFPQKTSPMAMPTPMLIGSPARFWQAARLIIFSAQEKEMLGSSGELLGSPQNAITASPMNLSTNAP